MRDSSLDDDLESELGRLPDLQTPEAQQSASPAQQIRRALRGKHVCPFCGTQRETDLGPCMHCSLEDTPTTRTATRSKLGPWYVLQSRNPSAPGMNFATLMTLVQKGKVGARSVLRGPTTGQFWRHAAKVKGVSREFGLCWSCGGDVSRTARACPSCKRLQEPPLNPDVLLEAGEFSGEELAEAMWSDQAQTSSQMGSSASPGVGSLPRAGGIGTNGIGQVDRLVARGGVRREVPPDPPRAPGVGGLSPRSMRGAFAEGTDQLPPQMGLDMAMFDMPAPRGGERVDVRGLVGLDRHRPRASRKVLKALGVALLLCTFGVVTLCTFDPDGAGKKIINFGERAVAKVKEMVGGAKPDPRTPPTIPAPAAGLPVIDAAPASGAPSATIEVGPGRSTIADASSAAATSLPQTNGMKVWDLFNAGKAAEQRGDYAGAVKAWEEIKTLGVKEDLLPMDLNGRIAEAKKRVR